MQIKGLGKEMITQIYDPHDTYSWTPLRRCGCGGSGYGGTSLPDLIYCYDCGAVYCVAASVCDPMAKRDEPKKGGSGK